MLFNDLFIYKDGKLFNKKTNKEYYNKNSEGYIRVRILGKEYRAHRIIWEMINGPIPEDMLIDHINGIADDNRIENLRLATRQQNNVNSFVSKTKKSGLPKGVTLNPSGKYRVRVSCNGRVYSVGTFNTIEEAVAARIQKDMSLNGEFVKVNT